MSDIEVPQIDDLESLGREARAKRRPIVLLVSREDCPYCERMKDEILEPMIRSGEYDDLVLIGELMVDDDETLLGFAGEAESRETFAERYGATLSPTLLFLAPNGAQLAARIRGINTVEMFGFYVDRAIVKSVKRLRRIGTTG